jgi:hypothetical protein
MEGPISQLTPISASKRAQAHFANALIDLATPAFASVTSTVLPYLASLVATASTPTPLHTSAPLVHLPLVAQPCADACIPLTINPLACPPPPSLIPHAHDHDVTQPPTTPRNPRRKGRFVPAPDFVHAVRARDALESLLEPKRTPGKAAKVFKCDRITHRRLTRMLLVLNLYTHPDAQQRLLWVAASLKIAAIYRKSSATARKLCVWVREWVTDRYVPANMYGTWTQSMLHNGDLSQSIHEHLQALGVYRKAEDVVWYLARPTVQKKFNLKKGISLATARRWMKTMKYRWKKGPNGTMSLLLLFYYD